MVELRERVEPTVQVRCGSCSVPFLLAQRNAREWIKRGREPVCGFCRWPHPPMTAAEREGYRRWWIEESGLTACELNEIAVGLAAGGT